MRTHKEKDMEDRVDKRRRRSLQVQIDLSKEDEVVVVQYHEAVTNKLSEYYGNWKKEVVQAILLRIELLYGVGNQLEVQFPKLAKARYLYEGIKRGEFGVLQELFPERYNVLRLQIEAEVLNRLNQKTQTDLLKELREIKEKLETLQSKKMDFAPQSIGGVKQLNVPQFAVPTDDEDDDLLVVKKDENAGMIAGNNFLASLRALQG
jgi:predicted transcriptional regulator